MNSLCTEKNIAAGVEHNWLCRVKNSTLCGGDIALGLNEVCSFEDEFPYSIIESSKVVIPPNKVVTHSPSIRRRTNASCLPVALLKLMALHVRMAPRRRVLMEQLIDGSNVVLTG